MNPLLHQFVIEARDFLQSIGEKLMALEEAPDDAELMTELFRVVHTLKGNSGLFEFPEMTRVLHAGEDLMSAVRDGRVAFSRELADALLDAMDFVGELLDEIEAQGAYDSTQTEPAQGLVQSLRALIPAAELADATDAEDVKEAATGDAVTHWPATALEAIPESARLTALRAAPRDVLPLLRLRYTPASDSFFKGEDPFHQARHTPGFVWGRAHGGPWPPLADLDCYTSALTFEMLVRAPRAEIVEYYRYWCPNEIEIEELPLTALIVPQGHLNGGPVYGDFVAEALELLAVGDVAGLAAAAQTLLELSAPELWLSSALRWLLALIEVAPQATGAMEKLIRALETLTPPAWEAADLVAAAEAASQEEAAPSAPTLATAEAVSEAIALAATTEAVSAPPPLTDEERAHVDAILATQADILALPDGVDWLPGRLKAVAHTLAALLSHLGGPPAEALEEALAEALAARSARPLAAYLADWRAVHCAVEPMPAPTPTPSPAPTPAPALTPAAKAETPPSAPAMATPAVARMPLEEEPKFGRRAEDAQIGKILKVDQARIDRLMNLIGEMVVAKNGLPYLAKRAEEVFGVRELSREIKAQYAVINRIAEEMQDAIMQVRMMPLSFVFQRFPRLVRDISRKLGKEVELIVEGEETEADKTIVEALADPLIHIVRNSLDHGLEMPDVRRACGKPEKGRIAIRARQESDRAVIEIIDDGRGIDPAVIKRKAYEKGLIDEAQLDKLSDQEAINLVFLPGFSTAETVSDLSGRGVGMDVVKNALAKVGGSVQLQSKPGVGTTITLSLPLSMAVTNVMIIESDRQIFGVPMDEVIETVRLPQTAIRTIKNARTAVLRGRVVPIVALNDLLAVPAPPRANDDGELAVLVVRVGEDPVGVLVDDFREVIDVIVKPLPGELARLACYAGTALLGDGSVLMILNAKELIR